jgi:hypothetical protein
MDIREGRGNSSGEIDCHPPDLDFYFRIAPFGLWNSLITLVKYWPECFKEGPHFLMKKPHEGCCLISATTAARKYTLAENVAIALDLRHMMIGERFQSEASKKTPEKNTCLLQYCT